MFNTPCRNLLGAGSLADVLYMLSIEHKYTEIISRGEIIFGRGVEIRIHHPVPFGGIGIETVEWNDVRKPSPRREASSLLPEQVLNCVIAN